MSTPARAAMLADLDSAATVPGWLAEQIEVDAAAGGFSSWGRSTVIDENTGSPVISEALFAELHRIAGLDAGWPLGNAGLLHVYGYLLSPVNTPYGRKRDRWLGGGVARAFGLPDDAFAPWFVAPSSATPSARDSTPLERIAAIAMPYVEDPAGGGATLMWVDERGPGPGPVPVPVPVSSDGDGDGDGDSHRDGNGSRTGATLARTVVVRAESGATALLYAVGVEGSLSLVTLFPLEWPASDRDGAAWLAAIEAGVPRLRYNAVDRRNVASAPLVDRRVSRRET